MPQGGSWARVFAWKQGPELNSQHPTKKQASKRLPVLDTDFHELPFRCALFSSSEHNRRSLKNSRIHWFEGNGTLGSYICIEKPNPQRGCICAQGLR